MKINRIMFLTFIINFLLFNFFNSNILISTNVLSVLIIVIAAAVTAVAFAVTVVYVVVIARVRAGFLILFIASFIF